MKYLINKNYELFSKDQRENLLNDLINLPLNMASVKIEEIKSEYVKAVNMTDM